MIGWVYSLILPDHALRVGRVAHDTRRCLFLDMCDCTGHKHTYEELARLRFLAG